MPGRSGYAGGGNRWLTNMSVAQVPETGYIAHKVLPMVEVPDEDFEYLEFDANSFYTPEGAEGTDTGITAPGASTPIVDWSTTDRTGLCVERKFKSGAPRRSQRSAKVKGYDAMMVAAKAARMAVLQYRERTAAAALFNGTTFASYTAALTSTDRWDDAASNPFSQRTTAMRSIRTAAAFNFPGSSLNLLVGVEVDDAIRDNDTLVERIKYTANLGPDGSVTTADIAAYFQVDNYIVGAASYNSARNAFAGTHTGAAIWGKSALFFIGTSAPARESAALGYTFYSQKFTMDNWYDQDRDQDWARAREIEVPKIVNARAGYYFTTVVG